MLLGIGNDIISIKRIKAAYCKFGKRFEERVYTSEERKLAWKRGSPCFKTLSNRWAAKEAFVKALGIGFSKGVFLRDISITNNSNGKPCLVISGYAKKYLQSLLPTNTSSYLHVSISDEKDIVNAIVIIEAREVISIN
ncbi:MAG: holo-ACP synthase [Paracoccaceae bacterium]|tara:strand:+ start:602 stop:1015 length:414 start_codon:yes stop_codon:yes gene_type:complete